MNTGGEAAEQIVRMSLEGFEVAAKITGAGAKNIAILLYSILKEEQKTKGKAKNIKQCSLSRARSTHNSDKFTFCHMEGYFIQAWTLPFGINFCYLICF